MYEFLPKNISPLEVVAFSALCAMIGLSIASSIGATVAYFATRPARAPQAIQARVVQPQVQPTATPPVQVAHSA